MTGFGSQFDTRCEIAPRFRPTSPVADPGRTHKVCGVGSRREVWADGAAYEAYVGRWSREVAGRFVRWLDVPTGRCWLDVGCGTGALTGWVLALAEPARVVGVDPSGGFLAAARAGIGDPRASFLVGSAVALPLSDRSMHAVVGGLALNFVPDPAGAVAEFARITVPGGVVGAYVWDYAEGMAMMRHFWDAAIDLDPAAADRDEGSRFSVCRPDPLTRLWTDAGLGDVRVEPIDIATAFTDFDDFWNPFLGGQGSAPGYVTSLPDEHRRALRDLLRSRLPADVDGRVHLTARAWAVRGTT